MSKSKYYRPQWKGPIEGYVVNFVEREMWRVAATMERSDVIHEAYLTFAKCAEYYPKLDAPQHFMALFKTAWSRRFIDMSTHDSRDRATFVPITARLDDEGEPMAMQEPVGDLDNDGALLTLIRQAPREVSAVLSLLLNAPQELLDVALASWNADGKRSNDGSARINRLLGLHPTFDSVGAVREYLGR